MHTCGLKTISLLLATIILATFSMPTFANADAEEFDHGLPEQMKIVIEPEVGDIEVEISDEILLNAEWLDAQVEALPHPEQMLKHFVYAMFLLQTMQQGEGDITVEAYHDYIQWLELPCTWAAGEADGEEVLRFSDDLWIEFIHDAAASRYTGARLCVKLPAPSIEINVPYEEQYEIYVAF